MIPTGWMPVVANGTVALGPCGDWMPAPAPRPAATLHDGEDSGHDAGPSPAGRDGHDQEHSGLDQPCSYAAAGLALAAPGQPPRIEPLLPKINFQPTLATAVGIGRGLAAPPPPATGPPVLS